MKAHEILEILQVIGNTGSRAEKERLLKTIADDEFGREILKWAYDPFITFGITPPQLTSTGCASWEFRPVYMETLLNGLRYRTITGNNAQATVFEAMETLRPPDSELLWRVLSKDLRCGITAKTVNLVMPGLIPTFDVMLSHKYERKRIKTFPIAMEPKLDGLRAVCLVKDGTAKFFSRVGNHFPALDCLGPAVVEWLDTVNSVLQNNSEVLKWPKEAREQFLRWIGSTPDTERPQIAFEGEVLSGLFAETSGAIRRKGEQAIDAEFHVFDFVPYDVMTDHSQKTWNVSYETRKKFLRFMAKLIWKECPIRLVPQKIATNHEQIDSIYEEFRNTKLSAYLAQGDAARLKELDKVCGNKTLEGAIVKSLDAPYEKKRSRGWLKMKAEETEDLRVTGCFEGEGKYVGKLGGLICDRGGVDVRVGGGFTDAERENLYTGIGYRTVIGRLIEVQYHEVTPDGSLRHPRFVRFRDDKDETLKIAAE